MVTFLTEGPLDNGGYPYDYEWFGSTLVVAELDHDGATKIGIYKRRDLLRWHRLAARFLRENEGEDYTIENAFHETRSRALTDEQPAASGNGKPRRRRSPRRSGRRRDGARPRRPCQRSSARSCSASGGSDFGRSCGRCDQAPANSQGPVR